LEIKVNFGEETKILGKNQNFSQKSKSWPKIKILVKDQNLGKNQNLGKSQNFFQT